jgi:hypothetical protein
MEDNEMNHGMKVRHVEALVASMALLTRDRKSVV